MITSMQRLRLLTLTSLAVLSSCAPPDTALRVNVTVRAMGSSRVRADCVRLTVSDDTQELKSVTIKRPADDTAVFAVRRGSDLPASVKVQAAGFLGPNCGDDANLKLNAQGEAVTGVFPESGVTELSLFLDPPNASLDADRDGFVAAARGGLDCRDDDNTVFPGAGQVCANTNDTDCDGATGCDDTECGSAAVCANPPDRVVITSALTDMLRYGCAGPFLVELQNAAGVRTAIRDTQVTLAASLPGVTVHGNCNDMPVSTLPINYGQSSFEVFLKADGLAFGATTLTATAAQVAMPGATTVNVHPLPIDHVEFTTPMRTLRAGECSTEQVTLEFRDNQNRRTDVEDPTTITLASAPGDLNNANIFFDDAACATPGARKDLLAGQGSMSVYLRARRAGSFTITATPSAGTGGTQPFVVQAAAAARLAFTNGPVVLNSTQACSSALFNVQLQDAFDNPVLASADVPLRVSVITLAGVTLHLEPTDCTTPVAQTDFVIPAGSNSVSFRAKGMNASMPVGQIQANVLNGANIALATQELRISAGMASRFTITGSPQSPLANVCSANPFSVQLLDSADNPASSTGVVTVTLTTNSPVFDPSFRFFTGAGCATPLTGGVITVPAGQTSVPFYFRGNRAVSSFALQGSGTLTATGNFPSGNEIRAGVPGKIQFVAPLTQTVQAGSCTPTSYVANLLDLFDNPTSFANPQTVTISSAPPGVTVGSSTCNTGGSVQVQAGMPTVNFIAMHTVTASYALTATVDGFSTPTPATMTVTPGPSTLSVTNPVGGSTTLVAGACQTITLVRRDSFMNNAPTSGTVSLGFTTPADWLVYPTANCTGAPGAPTALVNTHTVTFSVAPQKTGNLTMVATLGAQTAQVTFQVNPGTPSLVFEAPASGMASQTAGGCTLVTIARRDPLNNDVPLTSAQNVTFNLAAGTTVHTGTPCLPGNAITTLPVAAGLARTTFYVSATRSSATGGSQVQTVGVTLATQTANLSLDVSPSTATTLAIPVPSGGAATVTAGQCLAVTLDRRDAFNNLVPIGALTAINVAPALAINSSTDCSGGAGASFGAGISTRAFGVRRTVASGPVVYTFTVGSLTAALTLTVNPGPTTRLVVEGLPPTMTSRGCVGPLTVRRQDTDNNNNTAEPGLSVAMSSSLLQFSSQSNCASPTSGAAVSIAMGSAVSAEPLYATTTISGSTTAVATATAPTGVVTGNAPIAVSAGPATKLVMLDPPGTVVAGACSGGVRIELQDQDNNQVIPSSNFTVTLSSTPGTPTFFTGTGCTGGLPLQLTTANPTRNFSFIPTAAPASEVIQAAGPGGSGVASVTQTWAVTPGNPSKMVWKTNPTTPAARFACVSAGVIEIQDANNNVAPNNGATIAVTPTSTVTSLSFFTDATCTTLVTTLPILNGASETAEFFMLATGATPVNVGATSVRVLTAAPARPIALTGAGSFAITPVDPPLEAGACIPITVERRDNLGALFTSGTSLLNIAVPSATPPIVSLHLMADCTDTVTLPISRSIVHGASTTVVYARGRSALPSSNLPIDSALTAADLAGTGASATGTTTLKVLPLVRRGSCDIANLGTTSRCPLLPAIPGNVITRSFLLFSSNGRQPTTGPTAQAAENQNVECHLESNTGVDVVCTRVGVLQTMSINYQVVSFGRDAASGFGVSVQRQTFAATGTTTSRPLTQAVDTSRSFILTSNTLSGPDNDAQGFPLVRFPSTGASVGSVDVTAIGTPTARTVSFEVVTVGLSGAAVDHRNTTNPVASAGLFTITTNNTNTTPSFALAQAQLTTESDDTDLMCKRRFNVKVASGSSVTLHRGGATPPALCTTDATMLTHVQRVSIPGLTVRTPADVVFSSNSTSANTASFTAVAPHRSVTFLMMQGPGGQTAGESEWVNSGPEGDDTSIFHALLELNSGGTAVSVTRFAPGGSVGGVFSPIVVQFDP